MDNNSDTSFFKTLITNRGISIEELSQHHRVILLFIKFFGCPVCQQNIDSLTRWAPSLLQLNTIPVICHPESEDELHAFCANHQKQFHLHPEMIRLPNVTLDTKKQLGIRSASLMKHLKAMPLNMKLALKEKRILKIPFSIGFDNMTSEFAMFLIEKSQVINRVVFQGFCDRPDYAKFVLDLDLYFDTSVLDYQERMEQLFPQLISERRHQKRQSLFEKDEFKLKESSAVQRQSITLDAILNEENSRKVFKRFAMKEHSIENILFAEQVEQYKTLQSEEEREAKAKQILQSFLGNESLFQINVNHTIAPIIEEAIKSRTLQSDIFDNVLSELKSTVLSDSFMRFKTHISFGEVSM